MDPRDRTKAPRSHPNPFTPTLAMFSRLIVRKYTSTPLLVCYPRQRWGCDTVGHILDIPTAWAATPLFHRWPGWTPITPGSIQSSRIVSGFKRATGRGWGSLHHTDQAPPASTQSAEHPTHIRHQSAAEAPSHCATTLFAKTHGMIFIIRAHGKPNIGSAVVRRGPPCASMD